MSGEDPVKKKTVCIKEREALAHWDAGSCWHYKTYMESDAKMIIFRYGTNLEEAVIDVLIGIEFLKAENVRISDLIEYSL